jgi:NADPH2:quinone reductase
MAVGKAEAPAIVTSRYGAPDVLVYTAVPLPPLEPDEVRIRTIASAVNHTDLEIRAGNWPVRKIEPFPYVPGVEVVGVISEVGRSVRELREGEPVITMMQGLGGVRAERPGAYSDYVTVAASAVAPLPFGVDPYDIAALGLVGVTAYEGLRRIGALEERRILVTGAAGGVGSAAIAIVRAAGGTPVGLVARREQVDYVTSLGAVEIIIWDRDTPPLLEPAGYDGVLDVVGGELFEFCVGALRPGGVLSLVGAVGGAALRFDAWQLIRPVTLTGYSTEELDSVAQHNAVTALSEWLLNGSIKPPARTLLPLAEASAAHALLEQGGVSGRVLLVP